MQKRFVIEHSAWRQTKENYQIYLRYQFRLRVHLVDQVPKLSHNKMKAMFLSNMSESRRLTSNFFRLHVVI